MLGTDVGIIYDEVDWRLSKFIEWAQANHVAKAEIRTLDGKYIHLVTPEEAEEASKALKGAGIEVTALAAGFGKCNLQSPEERQQHLGSLLALVRNAEIFGTKFIRAFAGWRYRDIPVMWPQILDFFKQALEAVPEGMVLVVENEPATGCATLGDVAALWYALGYDSRIGSLFDPGNHGYDVGLIRALMRVEKGVNDLIEAEVKTGCHLIKLVHCKNTELRLGPVDTKTVGLNGGMIDFPRLFALFPKEGINVPLDLEPHRAAKGEQLSEALRATPGGQGYGNPDNASEDLRIIRGMLAEMPA